MLPMAMVAGCSRVRMRGGPVHSHQRPVGAALDLLAQVLQCRQRSVSQVWGAACLCCFLHVISHDSHAVRDMYCCLPAEPVARHGRAPTGGRNPRGPLGDACQTPPLQPRPWQVARTGDTQLPAARRASLPQANVWPTCMQRADIPGELRMFMCSIRLGRELHTGTVAPGRRSPFVVQPVRVCSQSGSCNASA